MSYLTREDLIDEALRRSLFPYGGVQTISLGRLRAHRDGQPSFMNADHPEHVPGWVRKEFERLLPVVGKWTCAEGGAPTVDEILAAHERRGAA